MFAILLCFTAFSVSALATESPPVFDDTEITITFDVNDITLIATCRPLGRRTKRSSLFSDCKRWCPFIL